DRIIITHGTYTLPDTARYIKAQLKNNNKTIIFVCSMIPLMGFSPTDAGFNLGYAVAKSQELEPGIYVCMNGRIFEPGEIVKILSEGRFGSIYTK
ncbi:MAG: asparaginase domain-containing protein, partial [Candidatus Magasanikiibacteriota bacterium]